MAGHGLQQQGTADTTVVPQSHSNKKIMRSILSLLLVVLIATCGAYAVAAQKAVVVSYPNDTPDSVLSQAKDAIREAV